MFVPLLTKAKQKGPVVKALGDKAYDAKDHFEVAMKVQVLNYYMKRLNACGV